MYSCIPDGDTGRSPRSPAGRAFLSGELGAELAEGVDVALDVVLGVLHRDRPLLLVAWRHEDASIHHIGIRRVVEVRIRLEEVAVVRERLLAVGHAPLRAQIDGVRGHARILDRSVAALGQHRAELAELVVGVLRQHLGQGREPRGSRQRVAVERSLLCRALGHEVHDLRLAPERADRGAPADRLGPRRQVWAHAVALGRAAVGDGAPALDLVVDENGAVAVAEVAQRLKVAGLRNDDADVHHDRLEDHRGDLPAVLAEELVERARVVEGDDDRVVPHRPRDALGRGLGRVCRARGVGGLAGDLLPQTEGVRLRHDREQHGVVVAVVGALHLHDAVAARGGAGDPDGVHRRLGAGVHEPHPVDLEATADLLGERDGRLGGDREVDGPLGRALDGRDDLRVGMADDVHAESAVEIGVLGPVDVPDLRPLPLPQVDRVGVVALEVRGHAGRQASRGSLEQRRGRGGLVEQGLGLTVGDLRRPGVETLLIHAISLLRDTALYLRKRGPGKRGGRALSP